MSRLFDGLLNAMAIVAGLLIALIPVLIVYDAALRILQIGASVWVNDFSAIFLVYATFLAAPWLQRERGHIYVEVIADLFKGVARRRLAQGVALICAAVCLYLCYRSATVVHANIGRFDVSAIETPRWVRFAPLPVGFFLLAVQFLRDVFSESSSSSDTVALGG
ncbi:TRAP transporter small permease [Nioella sp.]|uniref:TRAP transporter small permease n=1 Tax=Nioella sp. TaxID=1912091 RepID=UPI003A87466A